MTRRLFARALVMVSLAILGSCAGGGGSDVPNDLSGTVLSESGEAASGTKVFLRSARSTPDQPGPVWQTTADTRGEYHLPLVADTETWLLEWRDSACGCGTTRILASDWIRQERIPPVRLAKWGTLRGTLANGTSRPTEGIRVVIPGLQLSAIVEADGSWQIADVPEGIYQPAVEGAPAGAEVVADSVKIQAATGSVSPPVVVSDRPSRLVWMGLLRSPEGKPLAGVPLLYLPAEGKDTLKTGSVSDDSGRIAWVPTDSARGTVILANATNRWSGAVEAHLLQPDVFPTPDTLVLTKIAILRSLRATVVLPATAPSQTASEGFRLVLAGTSRRSDVVHSGDPVVFDSLAPGVHRLTAVRESNDAPWPVEWSLTIGDGDLDTLLKPSLMDIEDSTSWKALGEITLTTPEIQGV
ncbi:MAG TPA: hypothetical protein PKY05_08540, partial [Fibrobacteria bacterium]|nr:hypothetical protein [Fibrobacteria bacterium]